MSEKPDQSEATSEPKSRSRGCLLAAAIVVGTAVLVLCLLAGWAWASGAKAKRELAAQYPPPGQMVDVGGYRLHINCQGTRAAEGSPTVVIEAGLGDFSVPWGPVQEKVADFARVCTYDRAGLGWSDRSPKPRTAPNAVEELHALLARSGEEGPYVLVGHSLGGLYARLYAHEHPDQVAGMVLVDVPHEDEDVRFPEAYLEAEARFAQQSLSTMRIPQILAGIGILAASPEDYPRGVLPPLPPGTERTYKVVLALDSSFFETKIEEYSSYPESKAYMRAAELGSLGDIPLIVITAGRFGVPDSYGVSAEVVEEMLAARRELQAELATLSSNGRQVIAEESGHGVNLDQPEVVIDAIRQVVDAAQQ